jgi:serine phosphatase RsbU (regulator of sigma subunit)
VHVGGDLYDIVAGTTAGRWGFVVAEVCGKGAEAAALTALCHTVRAEMGHAVVLTTRALAYRGDDGRLGTVMFGHA